MKTPMIAAFVLLTSVSATSQALSENELVRNCISGLSTQWQAHDTAYSLVLLSAKESGGELLVTTSAGSALVRGTFDSATQKISFPFELPGSKEKVLHQWTLTEGRATTPLWENTLPESSTPQVKKSFVRHLAAREALEKAGPQLLLQSQDRLDSIRAPGKTWNLNQGLKDKIEQWENFLTSCPQEGNMAISLAVKNDKQAIQFLRKGSSAATSGTSPGTRPSPPAAR